MPDKLPPDLGESAQSESAPARPPLSLARVSLGTAGDAICTADRLQFQLDHALARDAVHTPLDAALLLRGLGERHFTGLALQSAVVQEAASGRQAYLRRPDLGRQLGKTSAVSLAEATGASANAGEVAIAIVDGLSALAVERHALPLIDALRPLLPQSSPLIDAICVVRNGRVAIGDQIGSIQHAKFIVVLIGERPGLSAPDSMGVYMTYLPTPGRTDAERNCISNIRAGGLSYLEAARRIVWCLEGAKQLGRTGVDLKANARQITG